MNPPAQRPTNPQLPGKRTTCPNPRNRNTASTLLELIRKATLLHELLFLFPPPPPSSLSSTPPPTPLAVASPRIPRTAPRRSSHGAALPGGDRYLHQHHRRRRGRRCPQARGETDLLPRITPSVLSTALFPSPIEIVSGAPCMWNRPLSGRVRVRCLPARLGQMAKRWDMADGWWWWWCV